MKPKPKPLDLSSPSIRCDFSKVVEPYKFTGWNYIYDFDHKAFERFQPKPGMKVLIFSEDGVGEVLAYEGRLEKFEASWRIRFRDCTCFTTAWLWPGAA